MADQDALDARSATPRPRHSEDERSTGRARLRKPLYVIERISASSMHYDFRLEIGGVLVSWTIPSEPSLESGDKRLAIRTDDAPLERSGFGLEALVWDSGTFASMAGEPVEHGLTAGTLRVRLGGRRLRGSFEMLRTHRSTTQEQWLLIKRDDGEAGRAHDARPARAESALSAPVTDEPQ